MFFWCAFINTVLLMGPASPFWGMNQAVLVFAWHLSCSVHEVSFPSVQHHLKFMSRAMPPSPALLPLNVFSQVYLALG